MTDIGASAFKNCSSLTGVVVGSSLNTVGTSAFSGCSNLTTVTFHCKEIKSWFSGNKTITDVVFGDEVEIIGKEAFKDCSGLTQIIIPNKVKDIGSYAFYQCSGLESVTLPNTITNINDYTFSGCSGLTSITIPNSVTNIERCAFENCSGLTSVTIPNSVTDIGASAFHNCSSLTSLEIPNSVTSIGNYAFWECKGLTSITLPNSGTNINMGAFAGCTGLTNITILNSETVISDYVFGGCSNLTTVTFHCKEIKSWFRANSIIKEIVFGEEVEKIDDFAFEGCEGLTQIIIPNTVIEIGSNAFYQCRGLTSVTLPNTITTIKYWAFKECSSLTNITIPNTVTSIGNCAFENCSSLTSVTLPNTIITINDYAFSGCSGLTSITIPNSVINIGNGAFRYCKGLTSIIIPNSVTDIGASAFQGCSNLMSLEIPSSISSIGNYAFNSSCLTSITSYIEKPFTINTNVFSDESYSNASLYVPISSVDAYRNTYGWKDFTYIKIIPSSYYEDPKTKVCYGFIKGNPDAFVVSSMTDKQYSGDIEILSNFTFDGNTYHVTSISNSAFSGCSELTSIIIPSSISRIESSAFNGCFSLTAYNVDDGNANFKSIDGVLFNKNGLTLIDYPKGKNDVSYIIPNGVTNINQNAFRECIHLTSLEIPSSISSIENYAFNSSCLTSITSYIEKPFTINTNVFSNESYSNASLYVPISSVDAYRNTYGWKNFTHIKIIPSSYYEDPKTKVCYGFIKGNPDAFVVSSMTDSQYSGDIVILSNFTIDGDTYNVTRISSAAFFNCAELTSISIPNSITTIESSAFDGCSGLTSITIPNSVTTISSNAFGNCGNIASITFNCSNVDSWFKGMTSIKEIILGEGVTSIGESAFSGCKGLTNLTISEGVTSIGYYAFMNCSGLTSVTIPSSVIGIGMSAFNGCSNLTSVTFMEGVEGIYTSAFYGCSKLTSITFPSSMTHIDMSAFSGCTSLTSITSLIMEPFVINSNVFSSSTYNTATLYVPFGTKETYKATSGWMNFKNIQEEKIDAGSSLILAVTDEKGTDITDNAIITWYDADGMEIGKGKSLNGIEDGTELYYSIELNENLGRIYREVKMQKVVAEDGELSCQLDKIDRVTLEGRISATDIDRNMVTISIKQMLNGKWEQTYTAQANEQGVFKVEVYDDETDIIISGDGYLNTMLHRDNFNGNGNVGTIPLSLISGFTIATNITIENAVADGETENMSEWTDDLNNIEFTLINSTKGQSVTDFTVQNGNVIIKSGVSVGDEIILTAMSKKGVFSNATTLFTIEEGANIFNLQLTELGGVDATYTNSNNGSTIGYLYDSNGVLAAKGSYVGETLSLRHLPNGIYTLISMGNSMLLGGMAHLSDFTATGLAKGTDYVKTNVEVSDGMLTAVSIGDVPKMDDTRFYYTSSNTYFNVNKASVTAGNYLTLQAHIEFKPEYADKADGVMLTIDLPEGCELVENSVIANRQAVTHNVNGNQLSIPLNKEQYSSQIRFCIIPVVNQDYIVTAMASFNIDGQIQQPIGTAQFEAKGLSLDVRTKTDQTSITVHGTTKGNSEVCIYDNDVLIGKTTSLADGSWLVDCELYKPYSHSFHDIHAKITTDTGMELTSITRQVEYNKNMPVPDKVTMLNGGSRTVFDLKGKSSPFYTYTASSTRTHNFTFLAEFTRNDTTVIKNVNIKVLNSDGTIRTLPAIFDGKQNCWVASTNYSSPFRLPKNVTVEYDLIPIEEYIINEERIAEEKINIHNIIDECVEAIKKVSYKIEEETDNSLVVRLDMESSNSYYLSLAKIELKSISNYIDRAIRIDTGNNMYNIVDTLIGSQDVLFLWDDKIAYRIAFSEAKSNMRISMRRAPWDPWFDENDHPIMNRLLRELNRLPIYGNRDWVDRCTEINNWWRQLFQYKETHIGYRKNTQKLLLATCPDGSYKLSRSQIDWGNMYKGFYDSDADRFEQFLEDRIERYAKSIRRRCYVSAGIQGAAVAASWAFRQFTVVGQEFETWLLRDPAFNLYFAEERLENEAINAIAGSIGEVSAGNIPNSISAVLGPWCQSEEIKIAQNYNSLNESIKNAYKKCEGDDDDDDDDYDDDEDYDEPYDDPDNPYFPGKDSQQHVDPSGFVYEAVLSNRLEGVTATCYQKVTGEDMYGDPTEEAVIWNAADYSQVNPQLTDETGFYRWDVPQGWWQVKYEKEGYETAYSDWLPVPPPQLDVNVGLKQSTPPMVKLMRGYESGITIEMSKYMRPETITEHNITVTRNGMTEKGSIEHLNAEQAPLSGEAYVSKFKFVPESNFNTTDLVVVTVHKDVESYCGVQLTKDYVETVKIEPEIKSIVADSAVTIPYQGEKELRVLVQPNDASAGKTLHIESSSSMIASVDDTDITIDQNGAAIIRISGELPGTAILDFSVDGTDITATSSIKVVIGRDLVATPTANIRSGEIIDGGTTLTLSCATEGATIYYTLDGSCPCDEVSRHLYDGPITIATDVVVKAIAVKEGMDDSDVATFVYIVNGINNLLSDNNIQIDCQDGTIVITGAEGASCHIYDLQGIEITSKTNLEKQAMIKVKSPNVYLVSVSLNNGQTIMQKLLVK